MKLFMKRKFTLIVINFLLGIVIYPFSQLHAQSILNYADTLTESCYTVPSWTLFKRAYVTASSSLTETTSLALTTAINNLQPKAKPYNVGMCLNGDPTTRMGFTWFTNLGVTGGKVQIIEGTTNDSTNFRNPDFIFYAKWDTAKNLNYSVSANSLSSLAGITDNTKKSYNSNKAIAKGLKANTCYSFRVGKDTIWSTIGHFTTAKSGSNDFSFIYTTDPQAQTDAMFTVSQTTTHAAYSMYPNANFWLSCGDLIETSGSTNSEWEYEQFFETQKDIWLNNPLVPVGGNHDQSTNKNISYHFNTAVTAFDSAKATCPGSVYSFVYGDALFMGLNYENYSTTGYLDSLATWMSKQVKANPDVKWRIAFYHKTMYTGSTSHQNDADGKTVREKMGPVFDSLKIDLALQGHDHLYEVIGPIYNKSLITNMVSDQSVVTRDASSNVKGLLGGTFNVNTGTLYFLNNSAGKKKYVPNDSTSMKSKESTTGVTDYFTLFTGRFGQNNLPTFSNVNVKSDSIIITTYSVNDDGTTFVFDKFAVVKKSNLVTETPVLNNTSVKIWPNPANDVLNITQSDNEKIDLKIYSNSGILVKNIFGSSVSQINIDDLKNGLYILKLTTSKESLSAKFVKE